MAPSTFPTILYRLEKNVNQSSSTFFWSSGRSDHSGLTSSFFRGCLSECAGGVFANEDWCVLGRLGKGLCAPAMKRRAGKACTRVGAAWLIGFVSCYIEYYPLDCYVGFPSIFTYESVSDSVRVKQRNGLREGRSRYC